jgi:guanyl-specific ribonuclease Sa
MATSAVWDNWREWEDDDEDDGADEVDEDETSCVQPGAGTSDSSAEYEASDGDSSSSEHKTAVVAAGVSNSREPRAPGLATTGETSAEQLQRQRISMATSPPDEPRSQTGEGHRGGGGGSSIQGQGTMESCSQLPAGVLLDRMSSQELDAIQRASDQCAAAAAAASATSAAATTAQHHSVALATDALRGLTFVVSGCLALMTRTECRALLEQCGGAYQYDLRLTGRAAGGRTTHLCATVVSSAACRT